MPRARPLPQRSSAARCEWPKTPPALPKLPLEDALARPPAGEMFLGETPPTRRFIVVFVERVLGIGGFFFRARNPEVLAAWYEKHLGITSMATKWSWEQEAGPTVFAPFSNFRVPNLDAMLGQLRAAGVTVEDDDRQP